MFNSMKNQFREKTGKELPKFMPQKGGLSRQSRQGSESSLSSLVLEPGGQGGGSQGYGLSGSPATLPVLTQDVLLADGKTVSMSGKEINLVSRKEEEWRARLEKREAEWRERLEGKEEEWKRREEALQEEVAKQAALLKDALNTVEEYKMKVCQYQEDKDQLEGFQTQEMAKIKHLLLAKEKENSEMAAALKESQSLLDSLKSEVTRLRPLEEKISNYEDDLEMLRHTSEKERWALSSKLAQSEEEVRHLTDRVAVLTARSASASEATAQGTPPGVDDRLKALLGERALLERRLEEAHVHLTDIKASWSAQISSLETQVGRLSRQAGEEGAERRRAEARVGELEQRLEEEVAERERLTSRITSLTQEVDSLASELKGASALIEKERGSASEAARKLADVEETAATLSNAKERLEGELFAEKQLRSKAEEELSSLKKSYEEEVSGMKESLRLAKEELAHLKEKYDKSTMEVAQIQLQLSNYSKQVEEAEERLTEERRRTEEQLEEERRARERERMEKEEALLRNAQVSQEVDIARTELRHQAAEHEELFRKSHRLEASLTAKEQELKKIKDEYAKLVGEMSALQTEAESRQASAQTEESLREKIANLEQQVADRNKNIRVLQGKVSEMRKTLQRELKSSEPGGGGGGDGGQHLNSHHHLQANGSDEEVNFLYLKNVIMKFLTSRDYEVAHHLTRAVATLLRLSPEEESLLKETLDWKMSWFGSKPRLHLDQAHS